MDSINYLQDTLNEKVSRCIIANDKNPVKSAIIATLDEAYELLDIDEPKYRKIDSDLKERTTNGLDDYYSAFQLMLELASVQIGGGVFASNNPEVSPQLWCSWYADIVVNGYAKAMRDKFNMLANSYADGNEFLGRKLVNESGLNLSHLDEKYKNEFGEL